MCVSEILVVCCAFVEFPEKVPAYWPCGELVIEIPFLEQIRVHKKYVPVVLNKGLHSMVTPLGR